VNADGVLKFFLFLVGVVLKISSFTNFFFCCSFTFRWIYRPFTGFDWYPRWIDTNIWHRNDRHLLPVNM